MHLVCFGERPLSQDMLAYHTYHTYHVLVSLTLKTFYHVVL